MYFEEQPEGGVSCATFLVCFTTLPMFYLFPLLLRQLGFLGAIIAGAALVFVLFWFLGNDPATLWD